MKYFDLVLNNSNVIEAVAICVGIVIFLIGYISEIKNRRRSHALEFMTQVSFTEPLATQNKRLYDLLARYQGRKPKLSDLNAQELETVFAMASFYEFVGLSLLQRLLSREIVLLSRYAAMRQTWDVFEEVIKERRLELGRPFIYGSFEKAVRDFAVEYQILQAKKYPEDHKTDF